MSTFNFNGSTYEIIRTARTWAAAKAYAEDSNGYLAIVNSQAENEAILNEALKAFASAPSADDGGGAKYVWLGASDKSTEGVFKWVNGSDLNAGYTRWGVPVEPDDFEGQDALAMALEAWPLGGGIGTTGFWNDIDENNAMYFVVEYNPATSTLLEASVSTTLAAGAYGLSLTGTQKINGTGNALDNHLIGNAAANVLTGLDGNDILNGGAGDDTLVGGKGNDTYYVDSIKDKITEKAGEGNDTVIAAVTFVLPNNLEALTLNGAANTNATGNAAANALVGNTANNRINGALGNDTLTGGGGLDNFVFDSKLGPTNVDTITDFSNDYIGLNKSVFKSISKGLSADNFTTQLRAQDANDFIIFNDNRLYYDQDGSGAKEMVCFAILVGNVALSANDLVVY
jgi:Ca2+-binding RTX toxin-like protein